MTREAETCAKLIAEKMFWQTLKGNVAAFKEIADRVEGRVALLSQAEQDNRSSDRRQSESFMSRVRL